ncbi:hypothetical protein [Crocosphaera chwakensis]|uniref:Uncharacterized protein n=1 Tax=Crocosphaera chwakensis CCY0110 TaxID=391612 RepID=A3IYI0_9CHRO|nr:hypothetical protein [Crocosphaera chwakensis]EAZ88470.1 hypothetical protein CY0110_26944 [Crocosphaera chwakensis CCY0110]
MHDMYFKPLSKEDRKKNEYLEQVNHAPYFMISMIIMAVFILFTTAVLLGVF